MNQVEQGFTTGFVIGLLASILFVLTRCFFRVEEGYFGVLTRFGRADFKDEKCKLLNAFQPGLHFKMPWDQVHYVSMMEQSIDLSGEGGGKTAMAEDGTILRLDSRLRFEAVEPELYNYLFVLRNPLEHIKGLFTCLLRNEIANFGSHTDAPSQTGSYALIRRERRLLNQRIEDFCRNRISGRYGVRFDAVDLTDILPPDELADALNAVINAHTEADSMYARAEGECQQRVLSSEKGVEIAKERSRAAETEITTLAGFLAELHKKSTLQKYVDRRRAEVLSEARAVFVRRST